MNKGTLVKIEGHKRYGLIINRVGDSAYRVQKSPTNFKTFNAQRLSRLAYQPAEQLISSEFILGTYGGQKEKLFSCICTEHGTARLLPRRFLPTSGTGCIICGNSFNGKKSYIKRRILKGKRHADRFVEWQRQKQLKHPSYEETLMIEALNDLFGAQAYARQVRIFLPDQTSRLVDFYLKERRVFLEVDGGYWHAQRPERDEAQNIFLKERLIRITASYKSQSGCNNHA